MRSLSEIKTLRKKYHLNQKELAYKANVSQSLIAKIEAGKVEPTFSKAQEIFQALDKLREKEETKASEIMQKEVFSVSPEDSVKKVISIMKEKNISQIPVIHNGRVNGTITEGTILRSVVSKNNISSSKVKDIMEEAPPIMPSNTGIRTISELLRDYSIVLVSENGNIAGIISKSDLLGGIE
jgi:predicted transcriptional regulator